jgi:branched-chain amino acid transport system substrate-binding protein
MKELGMNLTILGGDGLDSPKYAEIGQEAVNATYFSTHYASDQKTPQVQAFVAKFKKAYGGAEPDGLSTLGYDAILVLADAMKRAPSLQSDDLKIALANTSHFSGITGSITLDANRNPIKPAIIIRLENGKPKFFTSIDP